MRNLLACLILVPALAVVGCGDKRENMGVALDRSGHAAGENQGDGGQRQATIAGKNEAWHTMGPDESLTSVAKQYNVELGWLIKRNRIEKTPTAGTQIIVPARSTGGGAKIK